MRLTQEKTLGKMPPVKALPIMQQWIKDLGFKNSACDWASERHAHAFSFESHCPSTFLSPIATITYNPKTGIAFLQY